MMYYVLVIEIVDARGEWDLNPQAMLGESIVINVFYVEQHFSSIIVQGKLSCLN
jgi:hypothetical protein